MPRLLILTLSILLVMAAPALGHDGGEGLYGITNDKVVTNFGFALIAFFPLFIFFASLLMHRLEKRKDAKKAAAKSRSGAPEWSGGW